MRSWGWRLALAVLFGLDACVGAAGLWGLIAYARHSLVALAIIGVCVLLSTLLMMLRIPVPGGFAVTAGSIVSFLTIPILGPLPAAGVKFVGTVIGAVAGRTRPVRNYLPTALLSGGTVAGATLAGGAAFVLAGGDPGWAGTAHFSTAYLAMQAGYMAANIVLFGVHQAIRNRQSMVGAVWATLRQLWFNHLVQALLGLVSLAMVAQFRLWAFLVIGAGVIAVRFAFQLYADSKNVRAEMAGVLSQALQFKDPYTAEHSKRVAQLSVRIGRMLGLTETELEKIHDSALLHDIGKIAVPDAVLVKPGPLDSTEWQSMERHVGAGGELLEQSPHLKELADYVRAHHTDYDATTRPEALPFAARVIAVADAFDAMTSDRPYRKALPREEAIRRLHDGAGTQFDPLVVEALLRILTAAPTSLTPGGPETPTGQTGGTEHNVHGMTALPERASSEGPPLRAVARLRFPAL